MSLTLKIIISVIICLGVGFAAGMATQNGVVEWYPQLNKPSFNPPNWIFGPVWTVLYIMMGVAAALVWHKAGNKRKGQEALILFWVHLILNGLWSITFFYIQNIEMAFIVIGILWGLIGLLIFRFMKIKKLAGYLLIPYWLWVTFASVLNYYIMVLN